jgi:hypothetical protein
MTMAKSQKKSNREVRKPKKEKPKTQPTAGSFIGAPDRSAGSSGGGKKPGRG